MLQGAFSKFGAFPGISDHYEILPATRLRHGVRALAHFQAARLINK
jgi:hypothetical protein